LLNPQEELKRYRKQIYLDVVFLLNTRLQLLKEFSEEKNSIVWKIALSGFSEMVYRSLFDNLITSLSWLFSESKMDKRSLYWYLNQVKSNKLAFSIDEIDEQINQLNSVKAIVDKIKIVRDKWVAHRDVNAFNNPTYFLQTNNIKIEDFEILVNLAKEIIGEHSGRFDDTELDFDLAIKGVELLADAEKSRISLLEFICEIDISKRKPDFEERKNKAIEKLFNDVNIQY
jgi:hypothetical protein